MSKIIFLPIPPKLPDGSLRGIFEEAIKLGLDPRFDIDEQEMECIRLDFGDEDMTDLAFIMAGWCMGVVAMQTIKQ